MKREYARNMCCYVRTATKFIRRAYRKMWSACEGASLIYHVLGRQVVKQLTASQATGTTRVYSIGSVFAPV